MGSGRPRRHPAWARVPLLQLLYSGGIGADLVLDRPLSGATCPTDDRWVLYLDTDVVVTATGFDVGDILEALRTTGQHHVSVNPRGAMRLDPQTPWPNRRCSRRPKEGLALPIR